VPWRTVFVRIVMRLLGCCFAAALTAAAFAAPARAQETFPISGSVDGLYPGATATLNATVTNTFPFAIRVTSIGATPTEAGACPASMLTITGSTEEVVVQPGATGQVPLQVHLDSAAGNVCQGAFTIAFTGTAVAVAGASAGTAFTGAEVGGLVATGCALVAIGLALRRRARLVTR
jgi:hypothetical protein